jgi:hypothetical protein
MAKIKSFSKIEREVQHVYRNNLNIADSNEDVKKFFAYAALDLFDRVFEGRVIANFEDIRLDPGAETGFKLGANLLANLEFTRTYRNSDMATILQKLAESGSNHIKHLEDKHPDKTEAKIYPTQSHVGRYRKNTPPTNRGR